MSSASESFPVPLAPNFANPEGSSIDNILKHMPIPRFIPIHQTFDRPVLADPIKTFLDNFRASGVLSKIRPGMSVAVGAGSRGIVNLAGVTRALLDELKAAGAKPFIFPAMGSHGGATPQGQLAVLERMGFTEETMGVPFKATMDVVEIGRTPSGLPSYIDANAAAADGIVVVNRIKPHTGFRGEVESGLTKMIVIGVGKQKGAETCHNLGGERMPENLLALGRIALNSGKFLFGVAMLENAYHETSYVEVVPAEDILVTEPKLLNLARTLMPRLAVRKLDVLIIDEIGKNISGAGFDPNVVGHFTNPKIPIKPDDADVTRIVVLDLTDKSNGNATGLGAANFTTDRVFRKFSFTQTYPNLLTATSIALAQMPLVMANDRQAIQAAVKTSLIGDFSKVRMARIKNTLSVDHMEISENLLPEVASLGNVEVLGGPRELEFTPEGRLI